ncbi:hypothetical protein E2C01_072033 [Portunus trituberculatus]|uniref:Uncharacterized protein n=1 Tax=Portunus trituberculatus TaxID=210409 RepID=A0A5B7I6P2_PORTR|nr:hypothetical protein [Portunus trituberculatus]
MNGILSQGELSLAHLVPCASILALVSLQETTALGQTSLAALHSGEQRITESRDYNPYMGEIVSGANSAGAERLLQCDQGAPRDSYLLLIKNTLTNKEPITDSIIG